MFCAICRLLSVKFNSINRLFIEFKESFFLRTIRVKAVLTLVLGCVCYELSRELFSENKCCRAHSTKWKISGKDTDERLFSEYGYKLHAKSDSLKCRCAQALL